MPSIRKYHETRKADEKAAATTDKSLHNIISLLISKWGWVQVLPGSVRREVPTSTGDKELRTYCYVGEDLGWASPRGSIQFCTEDSELIIIQASAILGMEFDT